MSEFKPDWASPPWDTISDKADDLGISIATICKILNIPDNQLAMYESGELPITESMAKTLTELGIGNTRFWISRDKGFRKRLVRLVQEQTEYKLKNINSTKEISHMCDDCGEARMYCACPNNPLNKKQTQFINKFLEEDTVVDSELINEAIHIKKAWTKARDAGKSQATAWHESARAARKIHYTSGSVQAIIRGVMKGQERLIAKLKDEKIKLLKAIYADIPDEDFNNSEPDIDLAVSYVKDIWNKLKKSNLKSTKECKHQYRNGWCTLCGINPNSENPFDGPDGVPEVLNIKIGQVTPEDIAISEKEIEAINVELPESPKKPWTHNERILFERLITLERQLKDHVHY